MKKIFKTFQILIENKPNYIFMKLFSRIYIFKKLFLLINRFGQKNKFFEDRNLTNESIELSNSTSVNKIINDLNTNGCSVGLKLNNICLSKILDYTNNSLCYAYGNPKLGFYITEKNECEKKINKEILLAKYYNFQKKKPFADLVNSTVLKNIADIYLGKNAKNIATQLWWTFPADVDVKTRSKAAHYFHRDVDAWGFVKFFFYLNDVSEDGGPHVYVKKSHKPNLLNQIFYDKLQIGRYSDNSIRKRFGNNDIYSIYGSAGMGFVADTFGLHKGTSPIQKPRLVLCCVYATEDYQIQNYIMKSDILSHYHNT
jgi:hypothetical protein